MKKNVIKYYYHDLKCRGSHMKMQGEDITLVEIYFNFNQVC